jgi:hypothetical protein
MGEKYWSQRRGSDAYSESGASFAGSTKQLGDFGAATFFEEQPVQKEHDYVPKLDIPHPAGAYCLSAGQESVLTRFFNRHAFTGRIYSDLSSF